jgi:phosphate transport system substrate-binding protein
VPRLGPIAALALLCAACAAPPDAAPGPACDPAEPRPAGLLIAGSGSNLAFVRAIARRYAERDPAARVHVADSIGTGGAVRALGDGAIDIGLASRPLTADEGRAGIVATPLARVALVLAARGGPPGPGLSRAAIAALFRGELARWPDGAPVVPLLREPGDSGNALVAGVLPEVGRAMAEATSRGALTVCYTDQQMRDSLLETGGAVGFLDAGTLALERLPLRALAIDGALPTPAQVAAGRYPLVKELSFLTRGAPAGATARFIAFALGPETGDLRDAGGFVAPGGAR